LSKITNIGVGSAVAALILACAGALAQYPEPAASLGDTGIRAADPTVIETDDGFVAVESRNGRAFFVRVAPNLAALADARPRRIWSDRDRLGEVWAPEIVYRNGRYEIYFAAGVGSDHRMYRIDSLEADDGYGEAVEIDLPDDKWAIDGLPFTYRGVDYFVWSGWEGDTDIRQDLYLARMDDTGAVVAPRARIGTTDQRWENVAGESPSINEGPQPIVDPAGQLHIAYSANGSWGENYCIADLRLAENADPLDEAAWFESPGCLFGANSATLAEGITPTSGAKGIGHHSFVLPDGEIEGHATSDVTMPFLYHGVPADEDPANFWAARKWFVGTFEWQKDATYRAGIMSDTGWGLHYSE
jgi:GH43 family beta-xylosidase